MVVTVMQSIVSGPSQCQSEREKNVFVAERKAGHSLAARGAATERRMGQTVTGICAKDNNTDSHTLSAASLLLTLSTCISVSLSPIQILSESCSLNRESPPRVCLGGVGREGGRGEGGVEGSGGKTSSRVLQY